MAWQIDAQLGDRGVGPAGSGKSLIPEDIAEKLGLPFYYNGPLPSEYKLTGYKDAVGRYHATPFRKAFEHGGVYLFDEIDACSAQALVAFNTVLANGLCDFPDGIVRQHPNLGCLAAANNYGEGHDHVRRARTDRWSDFGSFWHRRDRI
ncbi:AAA family ATPase [Rhizobium etli]|uniref:AAA family ATPase n=1 Tax=Rhizobium etli TaxID=29449 RepID=UPI00163DF2FA